MSWWGRAGVGLLLAGAAWLVWYVVDGPGAATATNGVAPSVGAPMLDAKGNRFVLWGRRGKTAVKECVVAARRFWLSADRRFREWSGVTEAAFYEEGEIVARATAGHARHDTAKDELDVTGGVRVRLEDGRAAISTPTARWRGNPRRLTFPEPLTLTAPNAHFKAAKGDVDFKARRARLQQLTGVTGDARISSPRCAYDFPSRTLDLESPSFRAPGVTLDLARARLDTRTNAIDGERVTMKLTVTDLPRLTRGRHFLSATLAALAAAAPAAPVEGPAKSPERKSSQVEVISKGSFTGVLNERAVLDQGVHIRHKDTDFYCTRMEIFFDEEKKAERAIATGSPKAVDPRNTVTGEKFTINFKERRIVIETGVKVVTRPKESSDLKAAPPSKATTERPATAAKPDGSGKEKPLRDQIKGETTITADRVEYDYRRKNLVAEGKSLTIVNRDRTVRAQRLVYTDKTEDLLLTGTPIQYRDAKGQKLDFEKELKLNLKEGAETFDYTGLFTGTFLVKDDEEDEEEDTPSAEKPASEKAKPASEPAQPTAARQP